MRSCLSLLIGVNNQYRGRSVFDFATEFEGLLKIAVKCANDIPAHVIIVSIPDWGVTPFAAGRDINKIAEEIDQYNAVCESMAAKYGTHFIDITTAQRAGSADLAFLATDKLHPSGKEYNKWAIRLSEMIIEMMAQ